MATSLIALAPEILAALPVIVPYIKNEILQVEALFGKGTGATKKNTVVNNTVGLTNNLANLPAGAPNKLPAPVDPTSIENIVEMLVQLLKTAPGGLTPAAAASIVQAQVNPLLNPLASAPPAPSAPAGQTLKITGGTLQVSL